MLREEQNSGAGREKELAIEFSKSCGVVPEFIASGTHFRLHVWTFKYFGFHLISMLGGVPICKFKD
jgi:hypothetical protein